MILLPLVFPGSANNAKPEPRFSV